MAGSLSLLGWKDICGKLKPGILDALEQCPPTLVQCHFHNFFHTCESTMLLFNSCL